MTEEEAFEAMGTTAKEASTTIQGSLLSMKAAWKNLLVGMSDDEADLEVLTDRFVESVGVAAENIIPRIEVALMGAAKLIDKLVPIIIDKIPQIIKNFLPQMVQSAVSIVQSLVDGIQENYELLTDTALEVCGTIIRAIGTMLPQIIQLGFDLIVSLAEGVADNISEIVAVAKDVIVQIVETLTNTESVEKLLDSALEIILAIADGIVDSLPELVDSAISVISQIVDTLTDPDTLDDLLDAALEIILAIGEGLGEFLPELIEAAAEIATALVEFLLEEDNLLKISGAAGDLLSALVEGLLTSVGILVESAGDLTEALITAIFETDWVQVGADILMGIGEGLLNGWNNLIDEHPKAADFLSKVGNALQSGGIGDSLVGTVNYSGQSMWVAGSHADGLDYVPYDGYIAELHKGEMVVTEEDAESLRSGRTVAHTGKKVEIAEQESVVEQHLQKLIEMLADYFPQVIEAAGHDIVADDGTVVAHYAPKFNKELGKISARKDRGR